MSSERAPLRSGMLVELNSQHWTVKLNGSTVYLSRDGEKRIAVSRSKAESMPRVEPGQAAETSASATASATASASASAVASSTKPSRAASQTDAAQSGDHEAKLLALLDGNLKETVDAGALVKQICGLFTNNNTRGGVYMILITAIAGRPVTFCERGAPTDAYVLVKFGRADNFAKRFGQFTFRYTEVLRIDGPSTMEAELKSMVPANWMRQFHGPAVRTTDVLKRIGHPGNNAPSEWRIMSRAAYESVLTMAGYITSLNWRTLLRFPKRATLDEKTLTVQTGKDIPRANLTLLDIL